MKMDKRVKKRAKIRTETNRRTKYGYSNLGIDASLYWHNGRLGVCFFF